MTSWVLPQRDLNNVPFKNDMKLGAYQLCLSTDQFASKWNSYGQHKVKLINPSNTARSMQNDAERQNIPSTTAAIATDAFREMLAQEGQSAVRLC